ncbi:MAG TPA: GMC family oxidoreductase [Flavisolibacter sp.]|jgi:choline dehydrogenase-like flavoprotein|nr:GMC family oxidoreductase [Flavisolibacter sp.]
MNEHFDIVVIGSGAGGAPIANQLVKKGKKVLVLEKGPKILPQYQDPCNLSGFKRDELYATGAEKVVNIAGVANQGASYYTSHVEPDLNDEPHIYRHRDRESGAEDDRVTIEGYTAQVVGGGTQIYGAVSLRFTEDDFRLKSFNEGRTDLKNDPDGTVQREARDWPVSYAEMEPYYTKAEKLVGINGTAENQAKTFSAVHYQKPLDPNPISQYVADGMDKLGMKRYRTPLAVITEDHPESGRKKGYPTTSFVNRYGDPMGYKSSTWVALLSPIQEAPNFQIRCNCNVTHLESNGSKVARVHYRGPSGEDVVVEGDIIVVACSAIESVRLLQLSGLMDPQGFGKRLSSNDLLGKYFLTHCFGGAEVRVPERFDKSVSLDSDWATDFCAAADYIREKGLWAGGAIYNNTSDQALPISLARTHESQDLDTIWSAFVNDSSLTGEKLLDLFDRDFGRRLSVSFMANQVPLKYNRIELHPAVKDKWNRPVAYIIKEWHPHDQYLMSVLAKECERILLAGVPNAENVSSGGVYQAENARARIANHILGGARFGDDPADSVLDKNCRHWQFDNLYVTDGSFMPTSGSANPTLTIEANSFRVADHLLTII